MRRKDREITNPRAMVEILHKGNVCHVALSDGGFPYLIALNYGFSWDVGHEGTFPVLYFHSAPIGKKIDIIAKNNACAFFVDTGLELVPGASACDWGMNYQSLAGRGTISMVHDVMEKKKGFDLLMNHYSGQTEFSYDEKVFIFTTILRLTVEEITGKEKN